MKLLLIDDHPLFRDGLVLLIQHRLSLPDQTDLVLLEAGNLSEAASLLRSHPDVSLALLDLNLGDRQGLNTLEQWWRIAPDVPVVVLSADERPATILSAIDRGAAGFIPKTAQVATMQDALRRVLSGGVYLPELPLGEEADALAEVTGPGVGADDGLGEIPPESLLGLSVRQLDVLRLLIEGKPNKEICRLLALSESTVKTHMSAIFRKLRVSSRTQVVVAVARAGVALGPLSRRTSDAMA
jgi:DNA-binding NarL/FixJ family response regulator